MKKKVGIKKFSLKTLFANNKFVLVFSLFAAIILWCIFVLNSNLLVDRVVTDVPVKIDTSGILSHFSIIDEEEVKVNVTIKGNRLAVSQVRRDDISVTAQASAGYVSGAGTFPFNLSARVNNADVSVTDINPSTVFITFDTYTQKELELHIDDSRITAQKGYIYMDSVSDVETVVVSGPSTVLDLVDSASVVLDEKDALKESKSYVSKIKLLGKDGNELAKNDLKMIEMNYIETRVTANVLKRATVKLTVDFANQPTEYMQKPFEYMITPQSIEVAAPESQLNISEYSVGTVDFHEMSPGSEFTFTLDLPDEILSIDNITTVKVVPNTSNLSTVKRNVTRFNVVNVPANKRVALITKQLANVKIVGNPDIIDSITSDDLYGEISWGSFNESAGEVVVPVKIKIGQYSDCWIFGKYEVTVRISDATT